ncbi:MAG TPA: FkbM family methyltransferase, partial [Hanamia sp.]|nr:FkbM family methyltransferase [Hanamia sp.]
MSQFKTPILFLIFNRPNETKEVFDVIKSIAPQKLYIAADGPRENKEGEVELCERVKEIVSDINWDCEVKKLFRAKNLGCGKAVSEAINWFFGNEEQGIILEDDCLPDLSFFPYCEQLLEKYKSDETIISIGGTNLGYDFQNDDSYAFSRFMNMWGWATWRRAALLVDYQMNHWKQLKFKKLHLYQKLQKKKHFDYNWIKLWESYFNMTANKQMNTWDYQWIYTQLYLKKLSVFPSKNLIKNIGFSSNATHTFNASDIKANLSVKSLHFPLKHPNSIINCEQYETDYVKGIWFSYNKTSLSRIFTSYILNMSFSLKLIEFTKITSYKYLGKMKLSFLKKVLPSKISNQLIGLRNNYGLRTIKSTLEKDVNFIKRQRFFESILCKGGTYFDIGANYGNRIGPALKAGVSKIIAVEPQKECCEHLKTFFPDITILQKGLGAKNEWKELYISDVSVLSSFSEEFIKNAKNGRFKDVEWQTKQIVEIITLDNLITDYGVPNFVKIDVEG